MTVIDEVISLFRRCMPYIVRPDETVRGLLSRPDAVILTRRSDTGRLLAAALLHKNCLQLLCTDSAFRRRGLGSSLLTEAESLVRNAGFSELITGAGEGYIMPGVPSSRMVFSESLSPSFPAEGLTDEAASFFLRRGYTHSWEDSNCFDMMLSFRETRLSFPPPGSVISGVIYRWASPNDLDAVCRCTEDAHPSFTRYYSDPLLYQPNARSRVLIAETEGAIAGCLIVRFEGDAPGTGSAGCTAVRPAFRGRRIATNLVRIGTGTLQADGLERSFIGYTYSGLDRLYGAAGYSISTFYLMAHKQLV